MNKYCEITFSKKIEEDMLVDLVSEILRSLWHRGHVFFLDEVFIGKRNYVFIFGRDTKTRWEILRKEISDYVEIKKYRYEK